MASSSTPSVAIIGAGLSGLSLALALHQQQIPCVIYEARPQPLDIGGAIMLSPNALKIMDKLGIYQRLSQLGYRFQNLYFRNDDDKLLDTFDFGTQDKHGYDGMRLYRFELIKVLLGILSEVNITPVYGKKFTNIVEETGKDITWQFADGSTGSATLLVGADGIHSRVRRHIYPDIKPVFTNMIGVSAAIPTRQLGIANDGEKSLPLTIMNKKHGAFVVAPQRKDGSEVFIGKQRRISEEPDREGWDRMAMDKQWCIDFLREGSDEYPPLVARAVADIPVSGINIWPFYIIPKLESWVSEQGRVVVLGDAAHAIPPTAGQGVNQAFEDVYTFALIMGRLHHNRGTDIRRVLREWQQMRQARVDGVLELNAKINKRRLPAESNEVVAEAEDFDLEWLYNVDFDALVDSVVP